MIILSCECGCNGLSYESCYVTLGDIFIFEEEVFHYRIRSNPLFEPFMWQNNFD